MKCFILVLLLIQASVIVWCSICENMDIKSSIPRFELQDQLDDYGDVIGQEQIQVYDNLYKGMRCDHLTSLKDIYDYELDYNVGHIIFTRSNLTILRSGDLTSFKKIVQLYMNNSLVETISPGAFNGLTLLEELHLEDNHIKEITKGYFNSLMHLQLINMTNNQIESIENNSFIGIEGLRELYLSFNHFHTIPSIYFHSLRNLTILDLSYNQINVVSENSFFDLTSLQILLLSHNRLINLPNNLLINNIDFHTLHLSFNYLNSLDDIVFPDSVTGLAISNNQIASITNLNVSNFKTFDASSNKLENFDVSDLSDNINLISLNLGNNLLKEIVFLSNMTTLQYLYLYKNQLTEIPIGCFAYLQFLVLLDLSQNKISNLEYGTFRGLNNLDVLDLSHNKLTKLHENSFHVFTNLRTLNISNNEIEALSDFVLKDHLDKLELVTLGNNSWICSELLKVLRYFNFRKVSYDVGNSYKVTNVFGIACRVDSLEDKEIINKSLNLSIYIPQIKSILDNAFDESKMSKYFNNDFQKTAFYKFFNGAFKDNFDKSLHLRTFNEDFENTTFYKYFTREDFFDKFKKSADETFSKYFERAFKNTTFFNFFNSSLRNYFEEEMKIFSKEFKNLDEHFLNGVNFSKKFNEEFKSTEFFKFFNESLKRNLDREMSVFNGDFRNSTFYEYFQSHFLDTLKSAMNITNLHLIPNQNNFESQGLVSSSNDKEIFGELANISKSIVILMSFMVIMLLIITSLAIFVFVRIFYRNSKPSNSAQSEAELAIFSS